MVSECDILRRVMKVVGPEVQQWFQWRRAEGGEWSDPVRVYPPDWALRGVPDRVPVNLRFITKVVET